jgi:hypothetical protein
VEKRLPGMRRMTASPYPPYDTVAMRPEAARMTSKQSVAQTL